MVLAQRYSQNCFKESAIGSSEDLRSTKEKNIQFMVYFTHPMEWQPPTSRSICEVKESKVVSTGSDVSILLFKVVLVYFTTASEYSM
mmetsp:Transcript_21246/g.70498  ORF Transcript_21246/g.70498 Transcript_21246/m.70498 type:complete len:87 (+) Transcript_21246:1691-1951(+)